MKTIKLLAKGWRAKDEKYQCYDYIKHCGFRPFIVDEDDGKEPIMVVDALELERWIMEIFEEYGK